jgi:hypothetical protein
LTRNNLHGLGEGIIELRYADDPWLAGVYSIFVQITRLSATPPAPVFNDGSLVREVSRPEVYVIFGRARLHVPDPVTLERLYGPWGAVQIVPDGSLATIGFIPEDGTLLREEHSAYVWCIEGGTKRHVTNEITLRDRGGWGKVRTVHDNALAGIPTGGPIS